MFSIFGDFKRKVTSYSVTDADKQRTINSINGPIIRDFKASKHNILEDTFEYPIPDMPTKTGGAQINLIRAVYDNASDVIDSIDRQLVALEQQKKSLQEDRRAHEEMLRVAQKFTPRD